MGLLDTKTCFLLGVIGVLLARIIFFQTESLENSPQEKTTISDASARSIEMKLFLIFTACLAPKFFNMELITKFSWSVVSHRRWIVCLVYAYNGFFGVILVAYSGGQNIIGWTFEFLLGIPAASIEDPEMMIFGSVPMLMVPFFVYNIAEKENKLALIASTSIRVCFGLWVLMQWTIFEAPVEFLGLTVIFMDLPSGMYSFYLEVYGDDSILRKYSLFKLWQVPKEFHSIDRTEVSNMEEMIFACIGIFGTVVSLFPFVFDHVFDVTDMSPMKRWRLRFNFFMTFALIPLFQLTHNMTSSSMCVESLYRVNLLVNILNVTWLFSTEMGEGLLLCYVGLIIVTNIFHDKLISSMLKKSFQLGRKSKGTALFNRKQHAKPFDK